MKNKPDVIKMIYSDPITRLKPEGEARLLKMSIPDQGDGLEYWEVRFEGESKTYYRWISTKGKSE